MRRDPPPRLIVVTDTRATAGRPLVDVIARVLRAGQAFPPGRLAIQLRDKHLPAGELAELGRALRALTRAHGCRLYVNDRVDLALALAADGVQLGRASLSPGTMVALAPKLEVGMSTHGVAELERARDLGCDFALLGPVLETPAKKGLISPIGLHVLSSMTSVRVTVIAVGGINASHIDSLIESGCHGVACIRSVLGEARPEVVTTRILQAFP